MELPELSLAPSWSRLTPECSSSESSETGSSRKRKAISDSFLENKLLQAAPCNVIDLQHSSERLPLDWEQCLDLKSGKMYFLNRKTLKKSWDRPTTRIRDQYHHQHNSIQKLDLELNISSSVSSKSKPTSAVTKKLCLMTNSESEQKISQAQLQVTRSPSAVLTSCKDQMKNIKSNDNMVAIACMNCHMLVIVSESSPTCPNCRFLHSIPPPAAQQTSAAPAPSKPTTFKPLDTLTLFS